MEFHNLYLLATNLVDIDFSKVYNLPNSCYMNQKNEFVSE